MQLAGADQVFSAPGVKKVIDMRASRLARGFLTCAPAACLCEDTSFRSVTHRRDTEGCSAEARGVIVASSDHTQQLQSLVLQLHSAGVHHLCEVRRSNREDDRRTCAQDRRFHHFVENVVNASGAALGTQAPFSYRCVDIFAAGIVPDEEAVADAARKAMTPGIKYVAALPDSFEDLVPLADSLGEKLVVAGLANDPSTSLHRLDKYQMQKVLIDNGVAGARQLAASSVDEARSGIVANEVNFPLIVKPTISCASDGVFLCRSMEDVENAVEFNIGARNLLHHLKEQVVVQEYLQGQEFVVNTVSLSGKHRVLDMWRVEKEVENNTILYGHQLLVSDSNDEADVVEFVLRVLGSLGVNSGAAHLEVVRTKTGLRLIEINARPAGHVPRATRQVGEDQISALVRAIADPDAFLSHATTTPHYSLRDTGCDELVMVVFLRSDKESEVHREVFLQLTSLPTFGRFDRSTVPMFADAVSSADRDAFWIASKTANLFSVPLTVVLVGTADALKEDLERIRQVERTMWTPFGTNDPSYFKGVLAGGDYSRWATLTMPKEGVRVQVKPGFGFPGKNGDADYYKTGDIGTVVRLSDDRVFIRWERTGLTSSMGKYGWPRCYALVNEEFPVPPHPPDGLESRILTGNRLSPVNSPE